MNKKIFMLLFFLLVLMSMSAVSAENLDDNNDTVVLSDDADMLLTANDVDAIGDLNENDADGGDETLQNDAKSLAAGEDNEIYSAGYREAEGDLMSPVLGQGDYDININFDSVYNSEFTFFMCDVMGPDMPSGTLDLWIDNSYTDSFRVDNGMCTSEIHSLDAGDHTWYAEFTPDGGGEKSTEERSFTIHQDSAYVYIDDPGQSSIEMGVGESRNFRGHVDGPESSEVNISSSNDNVAKFRASSSSSYEFRGYIDAVGAGTATITVSFAGNKNYKAAQSKTLTVTVKAPSIYVNATAAPDGDGSESKPFQTLNAALNKAKNGDTIMIASGTYTGENNTRLSIWRNLNFVKYGDGEAIFDAESQRRIWTVMDDHISITGLTFKNGMSTSSDGGGAIYMMGGNVINCNFIGNNGTSDSTSMGGAIYCLYYTNVTNCTFTDNTATYMGGAIYFMRGSNVSDCTFTGNTANWWGGAIRLETGDNTNGAVTNCAFVNNSAEYGKVISSSGVLESIDNNWWGSNNPDWNELINKGGIPSSYAVLNVTADTQNIAPGSKARLNYAFYRNGTTEILSIPERAITLSATGGDLDDTSGYLVNGEFSTEFSADEIGEYEIAAMVDNQELTINVTVAIPTWYVNASKTSSGDGKSEDTAFMTFKEAIDTASDGDIIMIAAGTYTGTNNTELIINNNLNFEKYGDGEAIFDAEWMNRIWTVNATAINITGLTFKNGKTDSNGGAIYFTQTLTNSLINAAFINNTASQNGGANYFNGNLTNVNITGNFINNTALSNNYGGANFFKNSLSDVTIIADFFGNKGGDGGANDFEGALTNVYIAGNYTGNYAEYDGGANIFKSNLTNVNMTGSYLINNAKRRGGANAFRGILTDVNIIANYSGNTANDDRGGANHFAKALTNANIIGNYSGNTAKIDGGANYFANAITNANIIGTYVGNTVQAEDGGANFFNGTLTNVNITGNFINNTASNNNGFGGANYFKDTLSDVIIIGDFTGNNAKRGGANYFNCELNNVTISGNFTLNTGTGDNKDNDNGGGANYFVKALTGVNITGNFINNTAKNNRYGGANFFKDALSDVTIIADFFGNKGGDGGANNFNGALNNVNIIGNYTGNYAEYDGGANIFKNNLTGVNIIGNYANNTANVGAGANAFREILTDVNITGEYSGNKAKNNGGANHFAKALTNVNIIGNYFGNTAKIDGGANHFKDNLTDVIITGDYSNNSGQSGGANYFGDKLNNVIISGNFTLDKASSGGGANYFAKALTNINITGNFINNTASKNGGANSFYGVLTDVIITGDYSSNSGQSGGANYFGDKLNNVIISGNFTLDKASSGGGANYFAKALTNVNITGKFINNTALSNSYGGANFFKDALSDVSIIADFFGNKGGDAGANSFENELTNVIIIGDYINNYAYYDGGANIFKNNLTNVNITGNYLNNTARVKGGANAFRGILTDVNIIANCSGNTEENENGGANYFTKALTNVNIIGNYFDNTALSKSYGGANYFNDALTDVNIIGDYSGNRAPGGDGGSNYFNGALTNVNITGSYLNNTVTGYGGSNAFKGTLTDVTILGNYVSNAAKMGGSNYFAQKLNNTFISGNFTLNRAEYDGGVNYFNAAITDVNIIGNFLNNTAQKSCGGANNFNGALNNVNIIGNYMDNSAQGGSGGANIFNNEITNVNIIGNYTGNKAANDGGANSFRSLNQVNIIANFMNNTAQQSCGGANEFKGTLNDVNITGDYSANTAQKHGGANYFGNNLTNVTISGDFINNSAFIDGYGGANYFAKPLADVNITGDYSGNTAIKGDAGANSFENELRNVNIVGDYTNNYAYYDGGANIFKNNLANVNITGNYLNNKAKRNGGANEFRNNLTDVNIIGNYFENNATAHGGANNFRETLTNVGINGNYSKNIAMANGGANNFIKALTNVNITGNFINNTASDNGGANNFANALTDVSIMGKYINNTGKDVIHISESVSSNVIHDSAFLNNNVDDKIISIDKNNVQSINNWFGNNATNFNETPNAGIDLDNWLFLNGTADPDEIEINETSTITFKLISYNATSQEINKYDASMNIQLELSQTLGELSQNTALIGEGILYTAKQNRCGGVTGKFETAAYTVRVLNGDLIDVNITVNNATLDLFVDDNFTIIATTTPSGLDISFKSDNESVVTVDADGKVVAVSAGSAIITVSAGGGDIYVYNSTDVTVTVSKVPTDIVIANDTLELVLGDSVDSGATLTPDDAGNLTYASSDETVVKVENGKIIALKAGNAVVTVSFAGDDKYATAENRTISVTVNRKESKIAAEDVSVKYNDPKAKLVATLTDANGKAIIGNLTVELNGESYTEKTDSRGQISIPIGNLTPKTYAATIKYGGDDIYAPSNATANIVVSKADTIISAQDVNLTYKDPNAKLVATIINEHGKALVVTLHISLNGENFTARTNSDGLASIPIGNLTPGKYNATIRYEGSENYNASTATALVIVTKAGTVISAPEVNVAYRDPTGELIANITSEHGKPLIVTLYISMGGKNYTARTNSDGLASIPIGSLSAGNYSATIYYRGSDNYEASTAITNVNVTKAATIISAADVKLTYRDPDSVLVANITNEHGKPLIVTLYITINGKTYKVRTDSNGLGNISVGRLTPGNYVAAIRYDGSKNYKASNTTAQVNVTKAETIISAADVKLTYRDPDSVLVANITNEHGKPLIVTLYITINGKTYKVRTDSSGQAILSLYNVTPGTHTATITYKGSSNYEASNTTAQVTVTKAETILTVPDVKVAYKDPTGELVATIVSEHGKPLIVNLNINFNGENYIVRTNSSGQASIPIGNATTGKHTATITFKGSTNYRASNTTAVVKVTKAATAITAPDVSVAYRDSNGELVVTIVSEHGKTLIVSLNVELNGKTYTVRTNSSGQASIPIGLLSPGTYTATITFDGSPNYKASNTTAQVVVSKAGTDISAEDITLAYKDPNGELVATVVNEHGKTLVVDLKVKLNGKTYTVRTNSSGQAAIPIGNLTPGTYTATISYKGSSNYEASNTTAQVTVTKAATIITAPDVTVAYQDPDGKLVTTIVNEHGKPLVVTMKVELDGKTYSVKTDSNGQASVSTANLAPGTYTAKISYKGSSNYNASAATAKIQVKK